MSVQKGNILLVLISGVSIIAIALAGYFFYQNQQLQKQTSISNQPPPSVTPAPTQDATANWTTYKNDKLGFELKLPPGWSVDPVRSSNRANYGDDIIFKIPGPAAGESHEGISVDPDLTAGPFPTFESLVSSSQYKDSLVSIKDIDVGGENGKAVETGMFATTFVFVTHKNKIYRFTSQNMIGAGIIATFKFTETPQGSNQYPNAKLYVSQKLGVSFYFTTQTYAGGDSISVKETGDKIYVYSSNTKDYTTGQWAQIFSKDKSISLTDTVSQRFLKGYSQTNCQVKSPAKYMDTGTKAYPSSYQTAEIFVPLGPNEDPSVLFQKWQNCPEPYVTENGISYFLQDNNHPDKYVYFSIGQYPIDSGVPNLLWQDTIKFL